ncbi:MAG: hypothetical protein GWN66_00675, partial [Pseudomonas stutzeri]|nr:hypothetical protein [Stutzerimonas stutzeri]
MLLLNGAMLVKIIYWLVEDGVVPEEWIEGEDWRWYDVRVLQGEELHYSLEEVIDASRRYAR